MELTICAPELFISILLEEVNLQLFVRDWLFFCQAQPRINMMQTKTEAIDYPYPTTNAPSLTIHPTLIVCEAVRRVCPRDDERDAKENELSDALD